MTWDPLSGSPPPEIREQFPKAYFPVASGPSTAPGYVEIGQFFTLIDPPGFEKNPEITKAIHAFDPGAIPAWCRWVFLSPTKEEVVFGRHALLRYKWDPHSPPVDFACEVPPGYQGPKPNLLERVFTAERSADEDNADLPGAYQPWDWDLVRELQASDTHNNPEEAKERLRHARWLKGFQIRHAREELDYMQRDFHRWAQPLLDTISDVERAEYLRMHGKRVF